MKKITTSIVMALLCLNFGAGAQSNTAQIKPLSIGDRVPDISLGTIINHVKSTAKLSDFKGKLIILDFWATWCMPCIKSLPDFQNLQDKFKDKVQFLLTTSEKKESIVEFLKARNIYLPSLVEEKKLNKLFPHNAVPHEVWIKDGKVLAITQPYVITEENITNVLAGQSSALPEKKDNLDYDLNKPLLTDGNGGNSNNLLYHSVLTTYLDGVNGGGGTMVDSLNRFKIRAINASVIRLYRTAVQQGNLFLGHNNRILLEVIDKERFTYNEPPEYNPAVRSNFYSYELIVPAIAKQKAQSYMLDDLNRYFGKAYHVRGAVEKRKVMCWILKKRTSASTVTKGGIPRINGNENYQEWQNQPFEKFFYALAYLTRKQPFPLINQTGIANNIDMVLPLNPKDMLDVKSHFSKYGLELSKEEREVEMLVLKNID